MGAVYFIVTSLKVFREVAACLSLTAASAPPFRSRAECWRSAAPRSGSDAQAYPLGRRLQRFDTYGGPLLGRPLWGCWRWGNRRKQRRRPQAILHPDTPVVWWH
jgi:hypothetical protein